MTRGGGRQRQVLVGLVGALVATGMGSRDVRARGVGDVDVGGYGGVASGHWVCGPSAQVRYAGVGARVTLRPGHVEPPVEKAEVEWTRGFVLRATGAAEHRSYRLTGESVISCANQPDAASCSLPGDGWVKAGSLQVGYDGGRVGVAAGVLAYERYVVATDRRPTRQYWPDVELRAGDGPKLWVSLGTGAYNAPTTMRPGIVYLGIGGRVTGDFSLDGHAGWHRTFDGDTGFRVDGGGRFAVSRALALTGGLGVSTGEYPQVHPEPRLGLAGSF